MCIFAVVSYNKTRWKKIRRPKLHTLRNSIMTRKQAIKLFQEKRIRTVWDDEQEKWYFCVADMVEALTDSVNPTDYIKKMKKRDPELAKGWGQIVTPLSVQTEAVNRGLIAQHNREFSASYSQSHLKRQNLLNNGWLMLPAKGLIRCKILRRASSRLLSTISVWVIATLGSISASRVLRFAMEC